MFKPAHHNTAISLVAVLAMWAILQGSAHVPAAETEQWTHLALGRSESAPGSDIEPTYGAKDPPKPSGDTMHENARTPSPQSGWALYVDPTHGFSIRYPDGFKVRIQDVSRLGHFTPKPKTSVFFMNPTMAAGDLAGIEPPDLEVRVYEAGPVDSLGKWLVSVGFAAGGAASTQPYSSRGFNGMKVCQSTMIAPGCSIYVLHHGFVYQLTPISVEGEAMIETFSLPTTLAPREP